MQKNFAPLLHDKQIANQRKDLEWLEDKVRSSAFDLYAVLKHEGKNLCFGCIQAKTSIRDRVTRDREPSLQAMNSFFWSIALVIDGEFLRLPKFRKMVNGGSADYPDNGWHGFYVFSDKYSGGRIYPLNLSLDKFVQHARKAADYWISERQWFNNSWNPEK